MENFFRVRKIVTHSGNAHLDDLLGVALLSFKYSAPIERKASIEVFEEETIYLDIGRRYEPPYLLDHHQSIDIPCSLILVIKHHFPELANLDIPEIKYIDIRDRFGLYKFVNIQIPSELLFFERIFTRWFSSLSYISPEDEEYYILFWLGKRFYFYLKYRSEELKKFDEIMAGAEEVEYNGVKILILDNDMPPHEVASRRGDVHVIVQPSSRNRNNFSVIKLPPYQDKVSLDDVAKYLEERGKLVFYHANKFMLVAEDLSSALEAVKHIKYINKSGED